MAENSEETADVFQLNVSHAAIHKAVRNLIVNTFGLTRAKVDEEIRRRMDEVIDDRVRGEVKRIVDRLIPNSARIETMIGNLITRMVEPTVKDEVRRIVNDRLRIDATLTVTNPAEVKADGKGADDGE